MERKNALFTHMDILLPLHELLNTHALQIHVLLVAVHLHALPIWPLTVFMHRNFPGIYQRDFLLQIRILSIAVHSHAEGFLPVFGLHAQDFAGFTHTAIFLCGLVNSVAVSCTHEMIVGSALLLTLTHKIGDCNFFPSSVCICFLGDFVAQDGLCFPTLLVVVVVVFLTCWGLL